MQLSVADKRARRRGCCKAFDRPSAEHVLLDQQGRRDSIAGAALPWLQNGAGFGRSAAHDETDVIIKRGCSFIREARGAGRTTPTSRGR
jgi:hypothetical protein